MKIAVIIVRTLLGLLFLFASIAYFFMPFEPPPLEGNMKLFNEGLAASGYLFTLLKVTELACGLLLVIGRFVPLALVALAPIAINILMVHIFLDRTGLPIAVFVVLATAFLAYSYREAFRPLMTARYQPLK
jgi:putative oxidoreductase